MKLKHSLVFAIAAAVLALAACTTTTVTAPDGTVTTTTTISGADVATCAVGIGSAVKDVSNDK